jgi:hypothetical protein
MTLDTFLEKLGSSMTEESADHKTLGPTQMAKFEAVIIFSCNHT